MEEIRGHITTYEWDGHKLKVEKNPNETEVISVKDHNGKEAATGEIAQLKLIDDGGKTLRIVSIPNGTIIRTHSSPGCTWYFFQGKWWRVCT